MRSFLRVSLVVLASGSGCVGGPVSDWPAKNNDRGGGMDDGEDTTSNDPHAPPPRGAGSSMDAGVSAPSDGVNAGAPGDGSVDGGAPGDGSVDGGAPCVADAGACRTSCITDAGVAPGDAQARLGCDGADATGPSSQ